MTRVAYLGGAWATNIGNAFYNVGLLHLLAQVYGANNVFHVPNLAGWYWDSPNVYDLVGDVDADLFVLSGPCFSRELGMYRSVFERLASANARVAFVSVGSGRYDEPERALVHAMLSDFSEILAFVTTRDRPTFEAYRDLPCPVFDGICGSMYVDEAVNVPTLRRPAYIVLNVDRRFEPLLTHDGSQVVIHPVPTPQQLAARSLLRRARDWRRRRTEAARREFPATVGPLEIIRTQSGAFEHDAEALFDRPGTHYSVIPNGYLAIYKSAELVITNRVHTSAATLALGGRARYITTHARAMDGRWALLDRVGASDVRDRPTTLDRSLVAKEKEGLRSFLADQANA